MPPVTTTSCGRPESSFLQNLALGNTIPYIRVEPPLLGRLDLMIGRAMLGSLRSASKDAYGKNSHPHQGALSGGDSEG